jgi:hypothetical protein
VKTCRFSQPHRRDANGGNSDQKCESELGRFIIRRHLRPEIFDAGVEWGVLARRYLRTKARAPDIIECYDGSGTPMPDAKARWIARELHRIEAPLRKLDKAGFAGAQMFVRF